MLEFFIVIILITAINFIGIALGYMMALNKTDNKSSVVLHNIFKNKEELEEAYVPDED